MAKITGIEIDGRHVRVVKVNGQTITEFEEIDAATPADALAKAAKQYGKPGSDTIVAWSGGAAMRAVDLPICPDEILPTVIRDVAAGTLGKQTGMVVAGVVSSHPDGKTRQGLIGAVDQHDLNAVYKAFGNNARILLSAFAYTNDGVYLAVRASGVEMSQVEQGFLNAARTLSVRGVDALAEALKEPGVDTALELDRYGDELVAEVRETLRQWAQDQRISSTTNILYIHGVGADVPNLREKLQTETARQVLGPPIPGVDLNKVAGREHKAAQALFAATSQASNLPAVWLKNPEDEQAKVARKAKEKQRRTTVIAIAAAALIIGFVGYPFIGAKNNLDSKKSAYQDAASQFAALADADTLGYQVSDLERQIEVIEASEANWPAIIEFITANTPPTIELSQMSASLDGRSVMIEVQMSDRTISDAFLSPEEWARDLIRDLAIPGTFPRSLAVGDDGTVSGAFSIPIPDDQRFFYSSQNPDPTLPINPETGEPINPAADDADGTTASTDSGTSTADSTGSAG